jgi:LPS-assembly protein
VFYLYVPFRDQDDIPRFDTGRYTFGFAQLFRENRFSGADRVGDANQVSLAVTSRLLAADSGRELVRGTIGRIFFLEDREVTLAPGGAPETAEGSDVVAEVAAELARGWSASLGLQWDPTQDQLSRGTFRARYQPNPDAVLNASYRFVRDRLEQVDLSGRWPVDHRLALVARWNWEVPEQRLLEGFAGLEYNSCCWAVRALAQRFLNNDTPGEEEYSTGVFLQLELKGLAGLGDETAELLRQQIPGYRNTF